MGWLALSLLSTLLLSASSSPGGVPTLGAAATAIFVTVVLGGEVWRLAGPTQAPPPPPFRPIVAGSYQFHRSTPTPPPPPRNQGFVGSTPSRPMEASPDFESSQVYFTACGSSGDPEGCFLALLLGIIPILASLGEKPRRYADPVGLDPWIDELSRKLRASRGPP